MGFLEKVGGIRILSWRICWDLVAHPVTQLIGEQALVDILDLSKVVWTYWGCTNTSSGLGLRMVKDSDL